MAEMQLVFNAPAKKDWEIRDHFASEIVTIIKNSRDGEGPTPDTLLTHLQDSMDATWVSLLFDTVLDAGGEAVKDTLATIAKEAVDATATATSAAVAAVTGGLLSGGVKKLREKMSQCNEKAIHTVCKALVVSLGTDAAEYIVRAFDISGHLAGDLRLRNNSSIRDTARKIALFNTDARHTARIQSLHTMEDASLQKFYAFNKAVLAVARNPYAHAGKGLPANLFLYQGDGTGAVAFTAEEELEEGDEDSDADETEATPMLPPAGGAGRPRRAVRY